MGGVPAWDGTLRIWDPLVGSTLREIRTPGGTSCFALAIAPDDAVLFTGCEDGQIRVWKRLLLENGWVMEGTAPHRHRHYHRTASAQTTAPSRPPHHHRTTHCTTPPQSPTVLPSHSMKPHPPIMYPGLHHFSSRRHLLFCLGLIVSMIVKGPG